MMAPQFYWDKIARTDRAKDTISAMRAHPNWMELRDVHGRSPWMHALLHCHSSRVCTQIGSGNAIAKMGTPDADGKNLWFYVCKAGSRQFSHLPNEREIQFLDLIKASLPSSVDAEGRGIAIQLLQQASDTKNASMVLHDSVVSEVASTGDPWVGSEEDVAKAAGIWRELCLHIPGLNAQDGGGGHTMNLADGLNQLAALHPPAHGDLQLMAQISRWACSGGYMDEDYFHAPVNPSSSLFLSERDFQAMRNFARIHHGNGFCDDAFSAFLSEVEASVMRAGATNTPTVERKHLSRRL